MAALQLRSIERTLQKTGPFFRTCHVIRSRYQWCMQKVNTNQVPEQERKSPKGKFGRIAKNISVALGRDPESLDFAKRWPFDVALVTIPAGKSLCPYHSHSAETEFYLVVSGKGSIRDKDGTTQVGVGDAFIFAPGEAHQLTNPGPDDFVYYVIADNPRGDGCFYPDSGKWAVDVERGEGKIVKGTEADYFLGEE